MISECRLDRNGHTYQGTMSTTVKGFTCQRWDVQEPHEHTLVNIIDYSKMKTIIPI